MSGNYRINESLPFCVVKSQVSVKQEEYIAWQQGELIQNAMPSLSPADRELLMTGMCDDCFPSEEKE